VKLDVTEGRVLVTGAAGMLGSELLLAAPLRIEALGTDLRSAPAGSPAVSHVGFDLCDREAVERLFDRLGTLAGVIHVAAYTAVDRAEAEEELAQRVNGIAPGVVAAACAARGIPLVLVSTDFVFDGTSERPYREDDEPSPRSVYGRTKLQGERAALAAWRVGTSVVRTQWLYGPRGNHFPGTILRLAGERERLQVVADQVGSPTSTIELAPALWDVLVGGRAGIYHAACEGRASWCDLARETLRLAEDPTPVDPCTTGEFPRPAPRPAFSVLDCTRLARLRGHRLASWEEALASFMRSETSANRD